MVDSTYEFRLRYVLTYYLPIELEHIVLALRARGWLFWEGLDHSPNMTAVAQP